MLCQTFSLQPSSFSLAFSLLVFPHWNKTNRDFIILQREDLSSFAGYRSAKQASSDTFILSR